MSIELSPAEQVLAQLGRQKWAVDARDAEALRPLYTADSGQVIFRGGPGGPVQIDERRGRDAIIAAIVAGWERTADSWYPGAMIHQIGSQVIEPLTDTRMRCRSYASFLGTEVSGRFALMGYGTYDDVWALDEGDWRLAERETTLFGPAPR